MFFFLRSNLHELLRREHGLAEAQSADLLLVLLSLAGAAVMALVGMWIARFPANYRRYDPDEYDQRFNGIGGTLLIAAALVSLEPVRLAAEMFFDRFLWSVEAHAILGRMGAMGDLWIEFNAVTAGLRIAFALLLVWLFYKKRRVFRIAAICYLCLTTALFLLHDFIMSQVFTANTMAVFENFSQVTRSFQVTLFFTPYLLFARRVNATLRN